MKKTITILVDRYYPSIGGAQKLVQSIAEGVSKEFNINIITKKLEGTTEYESLNGINIYRIYSPGRSLFDIFAIINILSNKNLRNIVKNSDIIQGFGLFSPRAVWFLSKIYTIPSIITMHEAIGKRWFKVMGKFKGIFYYLFERSIFFTNYDKIIGVSQSTSRDIIKQIGEDKKKKVSHIYPFLDFKIFYPRLKKIKNKKLQFINFGRPGITKGITFLVKAFDKFNKDYPKSELVLIINKDPKKERQKLEKLIEEIDNKNIILLDSLQFKKLIEKISSADVVVVPSLTEGFGFTAAEGSALGKPVLGTTTGSLPEVIKKNETGILVEPFSAEAIYQGLKKIKNPKLLSKFSKNGPKYIKKFTKEKTINNYMKLYGEMIKNEN